MNKKLLVSSALILSLTGCATQSGLYNWGNYEQDLFNYYHEAGTQEEVATNHIEFVSKIDQRGETPAPGLLAEAGTFYLLAGDEGSAVKFYQMEFDTWPESRPMMGILIENLESN